MSQGPPNGPQSMATPAVSASATACSGVLLKFRLHRKPGIAPPVRSNGRPSAAAVRPNRPLLLSQSVTMGPARPYLLRQISLLIGKVTGSREKYLAEKVLLLEHVHLQGLVGAGGDAVRAVVATHCPERPALRDGSLPRR